jgi:hypothetical protein
MLTWVKVILLQRNAKYSQRKFSAIEATEKNAGKECAACKQEHNTKKFSV